MRKSLAIIATALIALLLPTLPAHATTISTVYYTSADGTTQIPMDVYRPAAPSGVGVIAIHGGAWRTGGKSSMGAVCKHLAADGVLCFAPNYRLAPAHPWPAAYRDLISAVGYLRDHASQWGLDPSRLGGFGASAGGNLVGMLATNGIVGPTASWSGPTDLTTIIGQGGCECTTAVNHYAPTDQAKQDASPVFSVTSSSSPIQIANSTNEIIPLAQAYELRDALSAAGVAHQVDVIQGTAHALAYFTVEWPRTRTWLEAQL